MASIRSIEQPIVTGQCVALDSPIVEVPDIGPKLLPAGGLIHQAHQIGNLFFDVFDSYLRFGK
jgi:hypothetical protein